MSQETPFSLLPVSSKRLIIYRSEKFRTTNYGVRLLSITVTSFEHRVQAQDLLEIRSCVMEIKLANSLTAIYIYFLI